MALRVALLSFLAASVNCAKMDCGSGVPLCGTLTLQTGLGSGVYNSKTVQVHGLWPEVGEYGTSKCIKPEDSANPTQVYSCYSGDSGALSFETHEWTKHGSCAGVKNVDDYFGQICTLSKTPVSVLEKAKEANSDFASLVQVLKDQGYPVWSLDEENDQVLLSACAGNDGRWLLAQPSEMPSKCSGSSPSAISISARVLYPQRNPHPQPNPHRITSRSSPPHAESCKRGMLGPECSSDADCAGLDGCVRCALACYVPFARYCTDVPLLQTSFPTIPLYRRDRIIV